MSLSCFLKFFIYFYLFFIFLTFFIFEKMSMCQPSNVPRVRLNVLYLLFLFNLVSLIGI